MRIIVWQAGMGSAKTTYRRKVKTMFDVDSGVEELDGVDEDVNDSAVDEMIEESLTDGEVEAEETEADTASEECPAFGTGYAPDEVSCKECETDYPEEFAKCKAATEANDSNIASEPEDAPEPEEVEVGSGPAVDAPDDADVPLTEETEEAPKPPKKAPKKSRIICLCEILKDNEPHTLDEICSRTCEMSPTLAPNGHAVCFLTFLKLLVTLGTVERTGDEYQMVV